MVARPADGGAWQTVTATRIASAAIARTVQGCGTGYWVTDDVPASCVTAGPVNSSMIRRYCQCGARRKRMRASAESWKLPVRHVL
jgi:hypothetical protein